MGFDRPTADNGTGTLELDPEIARIVAARNTSLDVDLDALPVAEALALIRPPLASPPPPNSQDRWVCSAQGQNMRVRLYYPAEPRGGLPVLMHLHGGGFVTGTVEMDDARCARLARESPCIVASVDYPLAPEHPFPEPIEAAFAAWQWITGSAGEFGGDATRVAISGSSAGGHLAIGVCLLTRDRQARMPLLQLLTYPVIDPELATRSYHQFADGPFLTRSRMTWFWKHYRGSAQPAGQLWAPLTGSLAGLPPAHIITAECDVLRDEAEEYAAQLGAAGSRVDLHRYAGLIHGFVAVAPTHRASDAALDESAGALRDAFARVA